MSVRKGDIVWAARSYIGTPFHHQGRLPGVGLDCMGVPWCALRAAGRVVTGRIDYPRAPNGKLLDELGAQFWAVDPALAESGDLLIGELQTARHPWHGYILDDEGERPRVIHASAACGPKGSVVSERYTDEIRSRIVRAYDLTRDATGALV